MIKEHQELLEQIEGAEKTALGLYAKGCALEDAIRALRAAGKQIRERIVAYQREARKNPELTQKRRDAETQEEPKV